MNRAHWYCRAAVALASVGLILPEALFAATPEVTAPPAVVDLALAEGGILRGQVVNGSGQVDSNAQVTVWQQGTKVASTSADTQGNFAISGLRAGLHQVAAGEGVTSYRFWAPNTAPPAAKPQVLVVSDSQVARGNGIVSVLTNPWVLAGFVGAAIAVPLALNNSSGS
jgi:hypothetical protein